MWVTVHYMLSSSESNPNVNYTNRKILEIDDVFTHTPVINWLSIRNEDELIEEISKHSDRGMHAMEDAWGQMFSVLIQRGQEGTQIEIKSTHDTSGLLTLKVVITRNMDGEPVVRTSTKARGQ